MDPKFPGLTLKVCATHKEKPNKPNLLHSFFWNQLGSVCASGHMCEHLHITRNYSRIDICSRNKKERFGSPTRYPVHLKVIVLKSYLKQHICYTKLTFPTTNQPKGLGEINSPVQQDVHLAEYFHQFPI